MSQINVTKVSRDARGGIMLQLTPNFLKESIRGEVLKNVAAELGVAPASVEPILEVYWKVVLRILCEKKEVNLPVGRIWIGMPDQYARKLWRNGLAGTPFYVPGSLLKKILSNVHRLERREWKAEKIENDREE